MENRESALVTRERLVRQFAHGLGFPNAVAVKHDRLTFIIRESYGKGLTALVVTKMKACRTGALVCRARSQCRLARGRPQQTLRVRPRQGLGWPWGTKICGALFAAAGADSQKLKWDL